MAYCSRYNRVPIGHRAGHLHFRGQGRKDEKTMGAQDYHQWALPTHAAFSSLAFRAVSPHLLTQGSITRPFEGLVGT